MNNMGQARDAFLSRYSMAIPRTKTTNKGPKDLSSINSYLIYTISNVKLVLGLLFQSWSIIFTNLLWILLMLSDNAEGEILNSLERLVNDLFLGTS